MNLLQRLVDKVTRSIRKFFGLPSVDIETLPDLTDAELESLCDNMPKPLPDKVEPIPSESPFGNLSFEEGLKHDDLMTRSITADHVIGAYTTGASVSDTLVMQAVYVLLEGLDITVHDAANYKLLVDEARKAFRDQNEKQLDIVFIRQDKFLAKLADKTKHRNHAPKHHHKRHK